jgi:hypothetical protein
MSTSPQSVILTYFERLCEKEEAKIALESIRVFTVEFSSSLRSIKRTQDTDTNNQRSKNAWGEESKVRRRSANTQG